VSSAERLLHLVTRPEINTVEDFRELGQWISELEPSIAVSVIPDAPTDAGLDVPTLTISPGPIQAFRPRRGPMLQGQHLPKSAEYRALEAIGVPVPRWTRLLPGQRPELEGFDEYVVTKPAFGAHGADVRIQRRDCVVWKPPKTKQAIELGSAFNPCIVQEFVYTGPWPWSYSVATLFGTVLWAIRVEASHERAPLPNRTAFSGQSIVSSGRGCTFELADDPDVLALAERAHTAFPSVPVLNSDIVRDADTGVLSVVEVNSLGYTWHFSSPTGLRFQREFGFDLDAQFGGRRKAARILADACVTHAA
jgi:hypothetical protein